MIRLIGCIASIAMLAGSAPAFAQEAPEGEAAQVETDHRFNLNVSLMHALTRLVSIGGDLRHTDRISSYLSIGVGPGRTDTRNADGDFRSDDILCVQVIAAVHYTLLGSFDRGLYTGLGGAYLWMDRDEENSVRRDYEGAWVGPGLGYKYTLGFGMVVAAEVDVVARVYQPDGLDEDDVPGFDERTDGPPVFGPILIAPNLTVGWAF
jgi:hypothetical protein